MEQIKCINCDEISMISPRKRCTNCNYPLFPKEKVDGGINIDVAQTSKPSPIEEIETDHTDAVSEEAILNVVTGASSGASGSNSGTRSSGNTGKIEASLAAGKGFTKHVNSVANKDGVEVKAGWLIVHMKDTKAITYDLLLGTNVIGRPTNDNDVDIPIEGDAFLSRKHMTINVSSDASNNLTCELLDSGFAGNQKPSTNGTFINGNENRLAAGDKYTLKNNDSIQIGETVVVFRSVYEDLNVQDAATAVMDLDYTQVIVVNK
jgi:hypothetical protein